MYMRVCFPTSTSVEVNEVNVKQCYANSQSYVLVAE